MHTLEIAGNVMRWLPVRYLSSPCSPNLNATYGIEGPMARDLFGGFSSRVLGRAVIARLIPPRNP